MLRIRKMGRVHRDRWPVRAARALVLCMLTVDTQRGSIGAIVATFMKVGFFELCCGIHRPTIRAAEG